MRGRKKGRAWKGKTHRCRSCASPGSHTLQLQLWARLIKRLKKIQIHKKIKKIKWKEKKCPALIKPDQLALNRNPMWVVLPCKLSWIWKGCYAYTQKWDTCSLNTHPHEKVAHKICGISIWQCLISTCSCLSRLRGKFRLERYQWHSLSPLSLLELLSQLSSKTSNKMGQALHKNMRKHLSIYLSIYLSILHFNYKSIVRVLNKSNWSPLFLYG